MGLQFFAWQQVPTPKLRPRQRPSHGTAMVAFMATDLVWAMEVMALATATARGLLMPMPGIDTVASTATDSQPMAVMATDCGERSKHYQKHRLIIICNKPNDLTGLDP